MDPIPRPDETSPAERAPPAGAPTVTFSVTFTETSDGERWTDVPAVASDPA